MKNPSFPLTLLLLCGVRLDAAPGLESEKLSSSRLFEGPAAVRGAPPAAREAAAEHPHAAPGSAKMRPARAAPPKAGVPAPAEDASAAACLERKIPRYSTIGSGIGVVLGPPIGGVVAFFTDGSLPAVGMGIVGGFALGQSLGSAAGTSAAMYACVGSRR